MAARLTRPQREPPLSREDAARWHMATPKNPMVIGTLLRFEQRLTLEALDQIALQKIVPHGRFRQHVVEAAHPFGRPRWRDDVPFDLRAHVQKVDLSPIADDDAFTRLVTERMNAPLSRDRSPWRMELIDLAPSGSALLVRIHHCIADGRALVALLQDLADAPGSSTEQPRSPPSSKPGRRESFLGRLAGLLRLLSPLGARASLLHRPLTGRKHLVWSDAIPLDAVKSIARAGGHRFVDVLLAGVAGALDRYHRDHGLAPPFLRALLPVAGPTRPSARALGNHFASVFVRLPVAGTDSGTRLETISREVAALKGGRALQVALGMVRLAGAIAPAIEHWAMRWWSRRASLVVSSLAGPAAPVRLAGRTVQSIVVWAPTGASLGLSLSFFGYAGKLHLGVLADEAVIARPDQLVAAFEAALEDLRRSALPDKG